VVLLPLSCGRHCTQQGDVEAAERLLSTPNDAATPPVARHDLGLVEERRRNWEGALALYARSAACPGVPRERLLRQLGIARALFLGGHREEAERAFAMLVTEDSILVQVEWAEVLLRTGDAARALALLQASSSFLTDARACFVQARALRPRPVTARKPACAPSNRRHTNRAIETLERSATDAALVGLDSDAAPSGDGANHRPCLPAGSSIDCFVARLHCRVRAPSGKRLNPRAEVIYEPWSA
jgi:hypothetical protein